MFRIMESKTKVTHLVHCPNFTEDKYEWWWVYLIDRKKRQLMFGPVHVTTLVDEEEVRRGHVIMVFERFLQVELKFQAPERLGPYTYTVCSRSDSYMDADISRDVKVLNFFLQTFFSTIPNFD